MIFFKMDTLNKAQSLSRICEKYGDKMEVDVMNSRYRVNGASILGLISLLGTTIEIIPLTDDYLLKTYFLRDVEKIGAYEVKLDG